MKATWVLLASAAVIGATSVASAAASTERPSSTPRVTLAQTLSRAEPATGLERYRVRVAGPRSVPPNGQGALKVNCPARTVVLGGGLSTTSASVLANIHASYPLGPTGWVGSFNNASVAPASFKVYAVCAAIPRNYAVVQANPVTVPAGGRSSADAFCPPHTRVFGGGGFMSGGVAVNMDSTVPGITTWGVEGTNATAQSESITAFAVCAKLDGRAVVDGHGVDDPPGVHASDVAICPTGTLPTGGGMDSNFELSNLGVNIAASYPNPAGDGWRGQVNNAGSTDADGVAVVVCAASGAG
jgi:hypothetical protein